jgi:hypothetical protein
VNQPVREQRRQPQERLRELQQPEPQPRPVMPRQPPSYGRDGDGGHGASCRDGQVRSSPRSLQRDPPRPSRPPPTARPCWPKPARMTQPASPCSPHSQHAVRKRRPAVPRSGPSEPDRVAASSPPSAKELIQPPPAQPVYQSLLLTLPSFSSLNSRGENAAPSLITALQPTFPHIRCVADASIQYQ